MVRRLTLFDDFAGDIPMDVSTSLLPPADGVDRAVDVGVVIDVLRATSVMTTALGCGASRIVTCRHIDQAWELKSRYPDALLCGERGCRPIERFDLGNSPAEYSPERVAGRPLVLTTTNGTRAIESADGAKSLMAASFLNLTSVIDQLRGAQRVHLICSGTEDAVTTEDVLLAGAIVHCCEKELGGSILDDESLLARQLWTGWFPDRSSVDQDRLAERLRLGLGGRNLLRVGYADDLRRCAAIDTVASVPRRTRTNPSVFELPAT